MRRTLLTVTTLAGLAVAGCGAQGVSPSTGSPANPPGAGSAAAPDAATSDADPTSQGTAAGVSADLVITVDDGAGTTARHGLRCSPDGGDHPDPQAACAALADPALLDPVPPEATCIAEYGGPQTATVTGTLDGAAVDAQFRRTDGCENARWNRAAALLAAT